MRMLLIVLFSVQKIPRPILSRLDKLKPYPSFFYVTITPYGRDIEPHVPDFHNVISDIQSYLFN